MHNSLFLIEFAKSCTIELLVVVYDQDFRKTKLVNNGFPNEILNSSFGDVGERLDFYPFSKVIDGY